MDRLKDIVFQVVKTTRLLLLVLLFSTPLLQGVSGQFDFGGNDNGNNSNHEQDLVVCYGNGTFQQQIDQGKSVVVGEIPLGLINLQIYLKSDQDVDIQLRSGETHIIDWQNGILSNDSKETKVWRGDVITYSGYNGVDGIDLGNEYVLFEDDDKHGIQNSYTMYAYGYRSGYATITYSWTDRKGCTSTDENNNNNGGEEQGQGEESSHDSSGSGSFSQSIPHNDIVLVGDLPAGLTDVYVRLESTVDIDIQLYDEQVDIAIINWEIGIMKRSNFERLLYFEDPNNDDGNNVYIEYSGYKGEQRPDTFGHEYIYISGTLPRTLTLKVLGYAAGDATVTYSWGYYVPIMAAAEATAAVASSSSNLNKDRMNILHNIIDEHTELSYSQCWQALQRTDQDDSNPNNVMALYSRNSIPKAERDNGNNGVDAWNREHVWAKSHGDFGTRKGAGTDIHALRVADKTVNSERSSKDFHVGGTQLNKEEPKQDCPLCKETTNTFEPPDEVKGAVARMIFYMAIRYNGDISSNGVTLTVVDEVGTPFGSSTRGNGTIGKLSTLKAWNKQYPPSDEEYHRNNLIYDIQGNRNPFIDHPEWVDEIFP